MKLAGPIDEAEKTLKDLVSRGEAILGKPIRSRDELTRIRQEATSWQKYCATALGTVFENPESAIREVFWLPVTGVSRDWTRNVEIFQRETAGKVEGLRSLIERLSMFNRPGTSRPTEPPKTQRPSPTSDLHPGSVAEGTVTVTLGFRPPDRYEQVAKGVALELGLEILEVHAMSDSVVARVRSSHPSNKVFTDRCKSFNESVSAQLLRESDQQPDPALVGGTTTINNHGTIQNSNLGPSGTVNGDSTQNVQPAAASQGRLQAIIDSALGRFIGGLMLAAAVGGLIYFGFWWPTADDLADQQTQSGSDIQEDAVAE